MQSAATFVLQDGHEFEDLTKQDFPGMENKDIVKVLETKMKKLQINLESKPVKEEKRLLFQLISNSLKEADDARKYEISTKGGYDTFSDLLTSICNGSIIIKLVNKNKFAPAEKYREFFGERCTAHAEDYYKFLGRRHKQTDLL